MVKVKLLPCRGLAWMTWPMRRGHPREGCARDTPGKSSWTLWQLQPRCKAPGSVPQEGDDPFLESIYQMIAVAAGNAHCVRSWVPKGRHPVGAAEGCGPQVRDLGLRGAGTHLLGGPHLLKTHKENIQDFPLLLSRRQLSSTRARRFSICLQPAGAYI